MQHWMRAEQPHDMGTVCDSARGSLHHLRVPALTLGIPWESEHFSSRSWDSFGSWKRWMRCKGKSLFSARGVACFSCWRAWSKWCWKLLNSLEADSDQLPELSRCRNSCHAFSDKEGDHILTSWELFSFDWGNHVSNRQTSGQEPQDWWERMTQWLGYNSPIRFQEESVCSYAAGSGTGGTSSCSVQEGVQRICPAMPPARIQDPSHSWDAAAPQLCAKCPPALCPSRAQRDEGMPPHNRAAQGGQHSLEGSWTHPCIRPGSWGCSQTPSIRV